MNNFKFITKTTLLLAFTVMFQMLGQIIPLSPLTANLIIGSLVNVSLAVSSLAVGVWGGIIISIAAPIMAFLQQHIKFVWLIPIIAGGNVVLVLIYRWLYARYKWAGIAVSASTKFLILYLLVKMFINIFVVPAEAASMLSLMFSWPQLVTALVGGLLAVPVLNTLINTYDIDIPA